MLLFFDGIELDQREVEYRSARWQHDRVHGSICVGLILLILLVALFHDISLIRIHTVGGKALSAAWLALLALRGGALLASVMLMAWLAWRNKRPALTQYEWAIFAWELVVIAMGFQSDLLRPATYYLSAVVEIPIVVFLYLVVPQHNRRLRILAPTLFSIAIAAIYVVHKIPPVNLGFETLFVGLAFANFIGIYFADRLYAKERQLYFLSTEDELTGLHNRRYLEYKLEEEWRRCQRQQCPLSICVLDIDFFKKYNDAYGHICGDIALKCVADVILHNIQRASDTAARFGGEEFVLILPDTSLPGSEHVAEKIRSELAGLKIVGDPTSRASQLTLSAGVAATVPTERESAEMLLREADLALYEAKRQGRNRVVAFASRV